MGWACSNPAARGHTGYVCKCRSSLMPRPLPSVWSRLLLRSVPEAIRAGPGAAGSRGSRPRGSCLGAAPRTRRALGRARGGRSASYSGSVSQGGPGSRQPCQGARQPPRDAASQGELRGQPAASQVSGRRLCPARRTVQDGRSEPTVWGVPGGGTAPGGQGSGERWIGGVGVGQGERFLELIPSVPETGPAGSRDAQFWGVSLSSAPDWKYWPRG